MNGSFFLEGYTKNWKDTQKGYTNESFFLEGYTGKLTCYE
jgi:hypothetical protein